MTTVQATARVGNARNNYRTQPGAPEGAPTGGTPTRVGTSQTTEERLAALRAAREKRNAAGVSTTVGSTSTASDVTARIAARRAGTVDSTFDADPSAGPPAAGSPGPTTRTLGATGARVQGQRPAAMSSGSGAIPVVASASAAPGRTLPSRAEGSAAAVAARRPSQVIIDKERKTDYWKDVERTATEQGSNLSSEDLSNVISRAMSLGIVGDKKQRESLSGPRSNELLEQLKSSMEHRLVELNGGRQINFDSLLSANTTMMDKIISLERTLTALESRKSKEEEEEKKRVQNKIGELERSLRALEAQKVQQREQNRRTMKLEIANLKEMMAKVQKDKDNETQAATEAKNLTAKMSRLEAALRLMNEERKKGTVEDKDTLLLRRKLALFEQKLSEMEAEKKMREAQDQSASLRDKLSLMEDKLSKMEKRKSASVTAIMQQKMEAVEKQLAVLRSEQGTTAHTDAANTKIVQKMVMLEKQLQAMASQKVTPNMIQDEETLALREHIGKMEEALALQEKRMEEQRARIEDERRRNHERRIKEEEAFREQARQKEEELIKRIQQMEARLKSGAVGGGGGVDPALIERLRKLEAIGAGGGGAGIPPDLSQKFTEMEKKLDETRKQLESERKMTAEFFSSAPKEGPELESWQKDVQIAWLKKTNDELMAKLEVTTSLIDKKMEEFKNIKFVPGAGGPAPKSGLSYAEINAKLAEIQGKLFDPNTDERESEQLNIEYEKLITELEQTPEYQKEQEEVREKWKKDNEQPNKEAFERVYANLKSMDESKLTAVFKRKQELRFILRTPDQLLKAHANDFKQVSTQNLLLIEARALYHNMPVFRRDQEQQAQFVQQLQAKIELEMSKPQAPAAPPIKATKKL